MIGQLVGTAMRRRLDLAAVTVEQLRPPQSGG